MKGLFTLEPHESKRLIAKGVKVLPEVTAALSNAKIAIAAGTTNGYVAEELTGKKIDKTNFAVGLIANGAQCLTPEHKRLPDLLIEKGNVRNENLWEAVQNFEQNDVFIKGANAIDPDYNAGILMGNKTGGKISVYPLLLARGCHLIIPVGREKMIPSVKEAVKSLGIMEIDKRIGLACGMMPIITGKVITEVEAFALLTGATAVHVASGGVGGSEGACTFLVEGNKEQIENVFKLVKEVKQEPPLKAEKRSCMECDNPCDRFS